LSFTKIKAVWMLSYLWVKYIETLMKW